MTKKTDQLYKAKANLSKEEDKEYSKRKQAEEKLRKERARHENKLRIELDSHFRPMNINSSFFPDKDFNRVSYDFFINHASEDKDDFVRPLAKELEERGLKVWYDEIKLAIGDSLRSSIDRGLTNSTYGIVVLSSSFFAKNWTQYELNGLLAREIQGKKVILPIWHKVTKDDVLNYSPSLADKLALNSSLKSVKEIVDELANFINR